MSDEKPKPAATVETENAWWRGRGESARWLGYGAILALYGAVVSGALIVRVRSQRSARPSALDLAVLVGGILGVVALGGRMVRGRRRRVEDEAEPREEEEDRFSHPAINVQRVSFA